MKIPPNLTLPRTALRLIACLTMFLLVSCERPAIDHSKGFSLIFEVQVPPALPADEGRQLVEKTIEVVKRRLDEGKFNYLFTALANRRFEIWVPDSAKVPPAEVERLVTATGVIDFRIAVASNEVSEGWYKETLRSLMENGPSRVVTVEGTQSPARWMEIDPIGRDNFGLSCMKATHKGVDYLLCYDDVDHSLRHDRPRRWSVKLSLPFNRGAAVSMFFTLDEMGTLYMNSISKYLWRTMAVLMDDKCIAEVARYSTGSGGEVNFSVRQGRPFAEVIREASPVHHIQDAGLLPARVTLITPATTSPATLPAP